MQISRNPLDFLLELASADLHCYGESFDRGKNGKMTFRRNFLENGVCDAVLEFANTASTESYDIDIGIPGIASTESVYKVRNLRDLASDRYYFNPGGPRLAAAASIFHTVITIPLRRTPWSEDTTSVCNWTFSLGSYLPYRQTELVGVVVLYLTAAPKLLTELQRYLGTVVRCAAPMIDLLEERDRYLRRADRGGNKYRRLRRALLAAVRLKKKRISASRQGKPSEVVTAPEDNGVPHADVEEVKGAQSDALVETGKGDYQALDIEAGPKELTSAVAAAQGVEKRHAATTQTGALLRAGFRMVAAYFAKFQGGEVAFPARVDMRLSAVAFVGSFVTISCWQVMTDAINERNDWRGVVDAFTLPGSFGALCTIVFVLPSVPLAQPRIFLLAHTWAMMVGVTLTFIFAHNHLVWLQKALALAITVSGMAKFGIVNPPAGAVSLIVMTYANSPTYSNAGLLFLVVSVYLGCAVVILVGVVWHNCFTGRTYPLYW